MMRAPIVERLEAGPAAASLVSRLALAQRDLAAFEPEIVTFVGELSRAIRRDTRDTSPAEGALAYWIRPAAIARLEGEWSAESERRDLIQLPRGVAFHVPPTNVDTLFVYSWVLSALMGNANVLRISPSALERSRHLLALLDRVLAGFPAVAATTSFVTYDRDEDITTALSQADLRVIWGGDETVAAIRSIPSGPRTVDLTFADRFSFALLDARAVLNSDCVPELARRLFNDAYWFDQLGCSSPRAVVWRGSEEETTQARLALWSGLDDVVDHAGYRMPDGSGVSKLLHLVGVAADGDLAQGELVSAELAVGSLESGAGIPRDSPGTGLFYQLRIDHLKEIVDLVTKRDQTICHYGLTDDELREAALTLGAAGVDRLVPLGSALTFDRYWDGYDLLRSFSRTVRVMGNQREEKR